MLVRLDIYCSKTLKTGRPAFMFIDSYDRLWVDIGEGRGRGGWTGGKGNRVRPRALRSPSWTWTASASTRCSWPGPGDLIPPTTRRRGEPNASASPSYFGAQIPCRGFRSATRPSWAASGVTRLVGERLFFKGPYDLAHRSPYRPYLFFAEMPREAFCHLLVKRRKGPLERSPALLR